MEHAMASPIRSNRATISVKIMGHHNFCPDATDLRIASASHSEKELFLRIQVETDSGL
jgi:hypothetical protein